MFQRSLFRNRSNINQLPQTGDQLFFKRRVKYFGYRWRKLISIIPPVLFIATYYHISGCNVLPYFKFLNFYVTFLVVTYYLAMSLNFKLLFIFSLSFHLLYCIFRILNLQPVKTRVILCCILKKEGRACSHGVSTLFLFSRFLFIVFPFFN